MNVFSVQIFVVILTILWYPEYRWELYKLQWLLSVNEPVK